jgi:hypothetical protein
VAAGGRVWMLGAVCRHEGGDGGRADPELD